MYNDQGSVDKALEGDYEFTIGGVLSEAWERVEGSKLRFLAAFFVYVIIGVAVSMVVSLFFGPSQFYYDQGLILKGVLNDQAQNLLSSPILIPLMVGMIFLGIRRAVDEEIEVKSIFDYYIHVWMLVFAALLINILTFIGFMLLLLPGIYLATAYMFTLPLIVEKQLGIWQAMELSRKTVTNKWFSFFFYNVSIGLIIIISAVPLGIGLFWTIPLAFIGYGILYRKVFGYTPNESQSDESIM